MFRRGVPERCKYALRTESDVILWDTRACAAPDIFMLSLKWYNVYNVYNIPLQVMFPILTNTEWMKYHVQSQTV
jgi:hypothetical protein